jgi:hypothetical protein
MFKKFEYSPRFCGHGSIFCTKYDYYVVKDHFIADLVASDWVCDSYEYGPRRDTISF